MRRSRRNGIGILTLFWSFVASICVSATMAHAAGAAELRDASPPFGPRASFDVWSNAVSQRARRGAPTVIIVGEVHGTAESPAFVEELVRRFHEQGASVSLLLEIKVRYAGALIAQPDSESARHQLCGSLYDFFVNNRMGHSSLAVAGLMERGLVRMHRSAGFSMRFIDGADGEGNGGRHAAMARIIAEELYRSDVVIALLGRYHPPKVEARLSRFPLAPDVEVLTLFADHPGGTAWNCTREGCGENPLSGTDAARHGEDAARYGDRWHGGLAPDDRTGDHWTFSGHYDANVLLPEASVSPPVFNTHYCTDTWWNGDRERALAARRAFGGTGR